jgi:hypothetical protein
LRKQYFSSEDQLVTLYMAAPSGASEQILPSGGDVRAHGGNLAVFDQDIGPLEVADRAVEGKHASVLDQKSTAGDGAGHWLLSMRGANYRGRGGNRTRRAGTEEFAP